MTSEPFVSYAQNAEDVVLARALRPDEQPGFWIDVGAGDPVLDSVTAAFAERGWTGINVDPHPDAHAALVAARPRDVNLPFALGARPGFAKLYPGPPESPGLSTLVPEVAERFGGADVEGPAPFEVEVRTLGDVLVQHAPPVVDFLKIDVEGYEQAVLAGADWSTFRPRIVVVEATVPGTPVPAFAEWEPLLLDAGYRCVLFDGLNRFYVAPGEDELAALLAAPASVLDDFVRHADRVRHRTTAARLADLEQSAGELLAAAESAGREITRLADELAAARAEVAAANEAAQAFESELRAVHADAGSQIADLARAVRVQTDRAAVAEAAALDVLDDLTVSQERLAQALSDLDDLAQYVDELEGTRTFRYTASVRGAYFRVRQLSRRLK